MLAGSDDGAKVYLNGKQVYKFPTGRSFVADEDTAFSNREADYMVHPIAMWEDSADDERLIGWVRGVSDAMSPFKTGGVYLNFTGDRDKAADAFGDDKYERLVALKDRYDPDNLFQHNQNIRPSRAAGEPALA